jgi:hypothetical protein
MRPKVVLYESKILESHRKGSLQESYDFMKKSGYKVGQRCSK